MGELGERNGGGGVGEKGNNKEVADYFCRAAACYSGVTVVLQRCHTCHAMAARLGLPCERLCFLAQPQTADLCRAGAGSSWHSDRQAKLSATAQGYTKERSAMT